MTHESTTRRGFAGCLMMLAALVGGSAFAAAPASTKDLVLVVGATGRTGVYTVEQLVAKGYRVRAFVRNADKARATLPAGVDIVVGDVRDPATIEPAMRGATRVISAIGGGLRNAASGNGPAAVDQQGNIHLIDAAKRAGVAQFVLVSSGGVSQAETYPLVAIRPVLIAKLASENHLRASGLAYTIVQPGGLVDQPAGPSRIVFKQEPAAEHGRISRVEVAQVCVAALGSLAARGKTFEVAAVVGEAAADLEPQFAALKPDAPPAP